jgi:hypothetical protein
MLVYVSAQDKIAFLRKKLYLGLWIGILFVRCAAVS